MPTHTEFPFMNMHIPTKFMMVLRHSEHLSKSMSSSSWHCWFSYGLQTIVWEGKLELPSREEKGHAVRMNSDS